MNDQVEGQASAGAAGEASADLDEVELTEGGTTRVVRVGAMVRRPARPWGPAVRALLQRLVDAGIPGVPRWHGVDEQGREIFDFLPGDVGNYPLPEQVRSDRALTSAARLLRRCFGAIDRRVRPALAVAVDGAG